MEDCIVKNFEYKGYGGTFINCVLEMQNFYHASSTDYNVFFNTILLFSYLHYQRITHSVVNNCILTFDGPTSIDLENSTFNNCIAIRPEGVTIFENQTNNMEVATFEEVFQTFTGTITFDNSYQLTDNIATSFLGNDNTEVGIYGGMAPYNTKLPYQIIKNCKVASRTDENQQLGVQIELNTNN